METVSSGLRWEREESSVAAQVNDQRSRIKEGKSYNDLVTMMGMENNEGKEEGEKKQPPTPCEESSVAAQASSVQRDHEGSPPKKRRKNYCSIEGCKSLAHQGGVCQRHGAKVKLCSSEGCTNQVVKGGVCKRHGANSLLYTSTTKASESSENHGSEHQEIQRQPQIQQEMTQHQQQLGRIQAEDNQNELAEMSDNDDAFDAQLDYVDEQEDLKWKWSTQSTMI